MANGSRVQWTFTPANGARRDRPITVTPAGRLLVMDELDAVADAAEAGLGLTVSSAEKFWVPCAKGGWCASSTATSSRASEGLQTE